MRTASKWAVVFLAAGGLGMWVTPATRGEATTQPSANAQAATGNISGVVMKDGKPLANAQVGLIDASAAKAGHGKRAKGAGDVNADQSQKGARPTPVATTTTDADGKFAITDVKVGDYVVMARVKGEGHGRSHASISSGETANVEIQLIPAAGGGGAGKAAKFSGGKSHKADKANKADNADATNNSDNSNNAN